MTRLRSRSRIALFTALALSVAPAFAVGQDRVPTREGNTWDWRDHEPVPSEVSGDEQAAGIAPPAAQQEQANKDVESLYRQLMENQGNR
jgi:hypothetical protein